MPFEVKQKWHSMQNSGFREGTSKDATKSTQGADVGWQSSVCRH